MGNDIDWLETTSESEKKRIAKKAVKIIREEYERANNDSP